HESVDGFEGGGKPIDLLFQPRDVTRFDPVRRPLRRGRGGELCLGEEELVLKSHQKLGDLSRLGG
ncbi:MAG: hypothetical protein WAN77_00020, partial [Thermoplasmata archaeon]